MDDRSTRALSVRNLRKRYKDVVAVDGIDLDVRTGECFGLLGPNGAGKTTTIEICEGLTEADSGDVEVLGLRWASDARTLRQRLGIQLQETQLADKLTVAETLRLFRSFYASGPTVAELIALVRLDEKRDARIASLSGGQKQRLALACALVGDPDLLFLDEPTTGLDPQARRQVWDLIAEFKSSGRTIVLTTHYMEEAERLCDRVAIVDHGKVIGLGSPAQLVASIGIDHLVEFSAAEPTSHARRRGARAPRRRPHGARQQRERDHPGERAAPRAAGPARGAAPAGHSNQRAADPFGQPGRRLRVIDRTAPA
jgi:ABC-2 type transport system ATP-binding protein